MWAGLRKVKREDFFGGLKKTGFYKINNYFWVVLKSKGCRAAGAGSQFNKTKKKNTILLENDVSVSYMAMLHHLFMHIFPSSVAE